MLNLTTKSLRLAAASAAACALIPAGAASASQQIGAVAPDGTNPICSFGALTTIGTSALYKAPAPGVITSMRTGEFGPFNTTVKFHAFRETIVGMVSLGQAEAKTGIDKKAGTQTRITVAKGDLIGLSKPAGGFKVSCVAVTGDVADSVMSFGHDSEEAVPFASTVETFKSRANVAATLEADADKDGFGDESQDKCVGKNGQDAGCPPAPPADGETPPADQQSPPADQQSPPAEQPAPAPVADPAPVPVVTPSSVPSATTAAVCKVPKLRGLTVKKAKRRLKAAHCTTGKVRRASDAKGRLTVRKAARRGATKVNLVVG